jgi:hypothetical protein
MTYYGTKRKVFISFNQLIRQIDMKLTISLIDGRIKKVFSRQRRLVCLISGINWVRHNSLIGVFLGSCYDRDKSASGEIR